MENEQDNEPPLISILCLIAVLALLVASVFISRRVETKPINELEYRNTQQSVVYQWESPRLHFQVLGSLVDKIIMCESSGNPTAQNPESSAYGLCQFLTSTWHYVEGKWDMDLDRDCPIDQLYACERLLREEGVCHWEESKHCWNK